MMVICNKKDDCDEANMCSGAVPHEETRACGTCSIKEMKCVPVTDERQFSQNEVSTEKLYKVFKELDDELEFAMQKFPLFPRDPLHAAGIISEEAGEVAKDAVQWTYEPHKEKDGDTIRKELLQTAAMCVRMICGIDSGDVKPVKND